MRTLGYTLLFAAFAAALLGIWVMEHWWQWFLTAFLAFCVGRVLAKKQKRERQLRYNRANIDAVNRLLRDP